MSEASSMPALESRLLRGLLATLMVAALGGPAVGAQQRTSTPALRLISAGVGPGGVVADGRFVLSEERATFSRVDDKELVATFQWEGTPGVHRMVATWRGPDGTVSASAPIEYEAKDRRFGAYWRFSLSLTMAMGSWFVDVSVDGQPGGRLNFEVTGVPAPAVATKRVLTQAQLFETLNAIHVVLERSTASGRSQDPAAGLLGADGHVRTVAAAINETERLQAVPAQGPPIPLTTVVSWSRPAGWAILATGKPAAGTEPPLANHADIRVGDRAYALDASPTGSRVLLEGAISGRTGGDRPSWIVGFQNGFARPGAAVMNESGEIVGLIDRPTGMMDLMRIQDELRGSPIVPYNDIKPAANAVPATLDELRARGELIAPVTGDVHILSGGFAVGINRGPAIAPSDQRTEFSVAEKGFTVFVTWNPQERLKGMVNMKLFTADNRPLSQSTPKKSDLRKQALVLTSWQIPMLRTPGVYRADITLDDRVMWRGYVTIRQ
jgi:hypothetical protein